MKKYNDCQISSLQFVKTVCSKSTLPLVLIKFYFIDVGLHYYILIPIVLIVAYLYQYSLYL